MQRQDIRKLDKLFSLLIRSRGKCERCGSRRTLQTSHIYSRRYLSIRWHPLNATCMCASCHWWWGLNPIEAQEWIKKFLGQTKYEQLKRLRTQLGKTLTVEEVKRWWSA